MGKKKTEKIMIELEMKDIIGRGKLVPPNKIIKSKKEKTRDRRDKARFKRDLGDE